jgi:hypothetical protein
MRALLREFTAPRLELAKLQLQMRLPAKFCN